MRAYRWMQTRLGKGLALALGLTAALALVGLVAPGTSSWAAAQAEPKLESTIFSYDGKDFIRAKTTMMTEDGQSAVNTKLDHNNPAYKALIQKHSYVGEVTAFGHKYDADYAPLTDKDGKLTGALFVGVAK
jgi:Cache 3/Cache 2 fusion domain